MTYDIYKNLVGFSLTKIPSCFILSWHFSGDLLGFFNAFGGEFSVSLSLKNHPNPPFKMAPLAHL